MKRLVKAVLILLAGIAPMTPAMAQTGPAMLSRVGGVYFSKAYSYGAYIQSGNVATGSQTITACPALVTLHPAASRSRRNRKRHRGPRPRILLGTDASDGAGRSGARLCRCVPRGAVRSGHRTRRRLPRPRGKTRLSRRQRRTRAAALERRRKSRLCRGRARTHRALCRALIISADSSGSYQRAYRVTQRMQLK